MEKVDITIIGAGVVGLAIAAHLSKKNKSIIILEKNSSFGQETSSRNSEVIHAGLYYPKNSLKAEFCVRGNALLYEYCKQNNIKHSKLGKIVVARTPGEDEKLNKILKNAQNNGVPGLKILSTGEVRKMEPEIHCICGMLSPSTGILDTHTLMQSLSAKATENGATISYNSEVSKITKSSGGYKINLKNDDFEFETTVVINSAGLFSDRIAQMAGIDIDEANLKLYYCKGEYFRVHKKLNVTRLIYPVPSEDVHSLGIHITPDLTGSIRLGPSAYYIDDIDYTLDERNKEQFYKEAKEYFDHIEIDNLSPDTCGIRPKLQGPDDGFKDFVIRNEKDRGFPGLINLIGIESPGLTSCLAIAEYIEKIFY